MIGTKLYKNNKSDMAKYTKTAVWCNANNAHIEDKGEYYEVLANIYKSRKNHKLDEWREFCKWIEELPYSELITGVLKEDDIK